MKNLRREPSFTEKAENIMCIEVFSEPENVHLNSTQ